VLRNETELDFIFKFYRYSEILRVLVFPISHFLVYVLYDSYHQISILYSSTFMQIHKGKASHEANTVFIRNNPSMRF